MLALDEQLAGMDGSMMCRAQRQEVRSVVATAFCARLDVVHVDERGVAQPGTKAAALIAREHGATQRRRGALFGARARKDVSPALLRVHVGVA